MSETLLTLLMLFYAFSGLLYILNEIFYIKKVKAINLISYVRFMYIIVYSLIPILMINELISGKITNRYSMYIETDCNGIINLYLSFLASVFGYLFLSFGYKVKQKNRKSNPNINSVKHKVIFRSALILFTLGLASLLLWTKVYGSPFAILEYSQLLRSGIVVIRNPLAFMKHFASLLIFSTYLFYLLILIRERNGFRRITLSILFLLSLFWSLVYLIANDGRMGIILIFLIIFLLRFEINSTNENMNKQLIKLFSIALIGFLLMSFADIFLNIFKSKVSNFNQDVSLSTLIKQELGFTYLSGQTSIQAYKQGITGNRIFVDAYNALIAWIPSSVIKIRPVTLFSYNTQLIGSLSGTIPTDFISLTIHELGILGVVVIPFILGVITKYFDNIFRYKKHDQYYSLLKVLIGFYMIKFISHSDFTNTILNVFFIIIGHSVIRLLTLFGGDDKYVGRD